MTPTEILSAMADFYASDVSYRDTGSDVSRLISQDPTQSCTWVKPVKTAFVRPDLFCHR